MSTENGDWFSRSLLTFREPSFVRVVGSRYRPYANARNPEGVRLSPRPLGVLSRSDNAAPMCFQQ